VRLSLVNLYLHGFTAPHIYEYDTLSSLDRWNEYADIILANPPFMSPMGGIKPHNRFSVKSKRSEVLFVDYIAEHLTPNGRAGIIVPEGIIFKSQNAYKKLRRTLVDDYLVAVVSLPAGVFNPYAGVKTSILILDQSLAKQTGTIAFFKVENDGFGLGAQRRPIDKNDLPPTLAEITEYLRRLRARESVDDFQPTLGLIVPKEKIAENGDYNLSGGRYRENEQRASQYPCVKLGEVCELYQPKTITQKDLVTDGQYLVFGANGVIGRYSEYNHEDAEVIITCRGATCGTLNKSVPKSWITGNAMVARPKDSGLSKDFLYVILKNSDLTSTISGSAQPQITRQSLAPYRIPLPPLDIQKEIVAEIDAYQKVIDGARAVLDNYRPHIPIDPDWPMVELSCAPFQIVDGDRGKNYPKKEEFAKDGYCLFLNTKNVRPEGFDFTEVEFISREKDEELRKGKLCRGDVVLTTRGTVGNTGYYDEQIPFEHIRINSGMLIFRPEVKKLLGKYLFHFFQSQNFKNQCDSIISGSAQPQLPIRSLNEAKIPLPPLATQRAIVAEIEVEQTMVNANRDLIDRMEKKIQVALARIWGEDKEDSAEA